MPASYVMPRPTTARRDTGAKRQSSTEEQRPQLEQPVRMIAGGEALDALTSCRVDQDE